MTQQTSDPTEQSTEQFLDRLRGVDGRRPGHCQHHGDFVDVHTSGKNPQVPKGWDGCPECRNEKQRAEEHDRAEDAQARIARERIETLIRKSGIPKRFQGKTLDDFNPPNKKAQSHLGRVREYTDLICDEDHGGRCLILLGKVGTGKTHLACAVIENVIRRTGKPCSYWTFSELVMSVKATFSRSDERSEADVYQRFTQGRLAVIDEVGVQNFTEFEQTVAYEAINARYMAEKPTILATNVEASGLSDCIGERAIDRLREGGGRALDFDWKSHRAGGGS